MLYIDINADVGEGIGNEAQLFPLISSCNIACGGHAGDPNTIKEVALLAATHSVKLGAHPSYPDRDNFGRISLEINSEELVASIQEQLTDFETVMSQNKLNWHHIKPHGALYNDVAKNLELAKAFLRCIEPYKSTIALYAPYNSIIANEAIQEEFKVIYEAFADRAYNEDLSLVSRVKEGALIQEPQAVLAHVLNMVKKNKVKTIAGTEIPIKAVTYCLHGDTPRALEIAKYLAAELKKYNITINN